MRRRFAVSFPRVQIPPPTLSRQETAAFAAQGWVNEMMEARGQRPVGVETCARFPEEVRLPGRFKTVDRGAVVRATWVDPLRELVLATPLSLDAAAVSELARASQVP